MTFGSYYYGGNNWQLKEVTGDIATKCWHTSDIELPNNVTTVSLQTSTPVRMVLFNKSDHSYVNNVSGSSGSILFPNYITLSSDYIIVLQNASESSSYLVIPTNLELINNSDSSILFKYKG